MFQHDPYHTGLSPYVGPQTNRTKFVLDLRNLANSQLVRFTAYHPSPIVIGGDGTIYVPLETSLIAINPDGSLKWEFYAWPDDVGGPAIGRDGTIYFVGVDSGKGHLYALHPDGRLKFRVEVGGDFLSYVINPVTISFTGDIYVASRDALYAFYPNGRLMYKYEVGADYDPFLGGVPGCRKGCIYSSPAVDDDEVAYITTVDGYVHAVIQGRALWKYYLTSDLDERNPYKYPVSCGSFSVSISNHDGTIWAYHTPNIVNLGRHGIALNKIYGCLNGEVYEAWEASPFAIGPDGTVYFLCYSFTKYSLMAYTSTGRLKWEFNIFDRTGIRASHYPVSPVVGSGGTVYFGDRGRDQSYIFAVGPDGNLKWVYKIPGEIESSLAIGPDGTLYFASLYRLYAIKDSHLPIPTSPAIPTSAPPWITATSISTTSQTATQTSSQGTSPTLMTLISTTSQTTTQAGGTGVETTSQGLATPSGTGNLMIRPPSREVNAGDTAFFDLCTNLSSPIFTIEGLPMGYRYVITRGEECHLLRIFTHPRSYGRFSMEIVARSGDSEERGRLLLIVREVTTSSGTTSELSQTSTSAENLSTGSPSTSQELPATSSGSEPSTASQPQLTTVTTVVTVTGRESPLPTLLALGGLGALIAMLIAMLLLRRRG